MLFMVIERFRHHDGAAVYRRFREKGRMLPEGLKYVDSWVEVNGNRCFQLMECDLMECDDEHLFQQWVARWNDLVDFEIVAVQSSQPWIRLNRNVDDREAPKRTIWYA
jgi:hypothetical protein